MQSRTLFFVISLISASLLNQASSSEVNATKAAVAQPESIDTILARLLPLVKGLTSTLRVVQAGITDPAEETRILKEINDANAEMNASMEAIKNSPELKTVEEPASSGVKSSTIVNSASTASFSSESLSSKTSSSFIETASNNLQSATKVPGKKVIRMLAAPTTTSTSPDIPNISGKKRASETLIDLEPKSSRTDPLVPTVNSSSENKNASESFISTIREKLAGNIVAQPIQIGASSRQQTASQILAKDLKQPQLMREAASSESLINAQNEQLQKEIFLQQYRSFLQQIPPQMQMQFLPPQSGFAQLNTGVPVSKAAALTSQSSSVSSQAKMDVASPVERMTDLIQSMGTPEVFIEIWFEVVNDENMPSYADALADGSRSLIEIAYTEGHKDVFDFLRELNCFSSNADSNKRLFNRVSELKDTATALYLLEIPAFQEFVNFALLGKWSNVTEVRDKMRAIIKARKP